MAIATEATGYSTKSVENGFALWERLLHTREPDEIVQLQSDFGKAAYDDFIAGATKISNIYADLAKGPLAPPKLGWPRDRRTFIVERIEADANTELGRYSSVTPKEKMTAATSKELPGCSGRRDENAATARGVYFGNAA